MTRGNHCGRRFGLVGLIVVLTWLASTAMGQNITAAITGEVTDPSGAVVVGARVTAENTETGVASSTKTNSVGVYTIRFLPIGSYGVTVSASGFGTQKLGPFTLEINQTAKINIAMTIGDSRTVTVEAELHPILDTTDSTLGNVLSSNEIANIPLNGNNFSALTLFLPGAVDTDPTGMRGNNAIERNTFNNGQVEINGNRTQENNYTIEGADNNEPQNNLIAYNPAPDAIAEVRVVAANANATYGNANGGAVVTILKSGTNSYHGSLYELFQTEKLNANTWQNGLSNPVTPKQSYTQNIFGGTFGGPILRNRFFFFGDYEGARYHTGGLAQASVLTPAMLKGDFSGLTGVQLYDSQNNFAPYKNNQVPVLNPVAQYLAANPQFYPTPNAVPTDGLIHNNLLVQQSNFISNNQFDVKVDWTPRSADTVNGFYAQGTGSDFKTGLLPVSFPAHSTYPTKIAGMSWVHVFSPNVINQARFGFTRVRWNNGVPSDPTGHFGLTGNQTVGIPFGSQQYVGFTGQSISNFSNNLGNLGANPSYIGTNANPQVFTDNTFNYYDNLTWQRGRHYFSIGGQATRYQQNYLNSGNVGFLGQFSYNGIYTSNPNAPSNGQGYAPADFVLGRISNVQLASPLGNVGNRQWRFAGYFQDDLKLTARLTLNLGLRYEYNQPWYEQNDKTANVLPDGTVEYAGKVPGLAVPGSIVCPTRACYNATYNQFMPRLGFAFQMTPAIVIRGGYGATSFFEGYSFNQRLTSSPPFSLAINSNATTPTNTTGGVPFSVQNAFSQPLGINNSLYSVWPQNTQPAYIHQFTIVTEYAITNQLSLSLGFHAQNGHHLADYRDGNQLTLAQAPGANAIINNSALQGCSSAFPTNLQPQYYSLVGECGNILITESEARMNYDSGQLTLRQRPHRGLEYSLNYTWSKSLTNSAGNYGVANTTANGAAAQDSHNLNGDYGPSGFDIRHSLNFIGVYDLPFGRGRSYGGNANGFVNAVLGGWKTAVSAFIYSGFPITLFGQGNSGTMNAFGLNRPNQYRQMIIKNRSISNWWGTDPSAIPCLTPGVDNGSCAYGNAGSFTFGSASNGTERGPGFRQVDASFFKDFHVWREHVVGFRADFFNIFNIASYGNPDSSVNDYSSDPTQNNFGKITSARSPERQIQLGLHYMF